MLPSYINSNIFNLLSHELIFIITQKYYIDII
nr:MAG TPA: hypothetical protein [Caudoviricetes sp.]